MGKTSKMDINDPGLRDAMSAMKPGDKIEVESSEGPITIGVPRLESDKPVYSQQYQEDCGSWLD